MAILQFIVAGQTLPFTPVTSERKERGLPSISESAEIQHWDADGTQDLPPHRAAIPLAPTFLHTETMHRRRALVGLTIVFSLALHAGFFWAASIWGQGAPLPDADDITAVIRVEVAEIRPSETVIEKTLQPAEATQPRAQGASMPSELMQARVDEASAPSEPAQSRADDTSTPSEPAQVRAADATTPSEPPQARAEDTSAPSEPAQARADDASAPSEPAQSQAADASAPFEPAQSRADDDSAPPEPAQSRAAEVSTRSETLPPRAEEAAAQPPTIAASEQPSPAESKVEIEVAPAATGAAQAEDAGILAMAAAGTGEKGAAPARAREKRPTLAAPAEGRVAPEIIIASASEQAFNTANAPANGYKPPNLPGKGAENDSAMPRFSGNGARRQRARSASDRGAAISYKQRVRAQVIRNLPEGRWGPGRVVISLRLSRSGALLAASVWRPSGNFAVDQAALSCVRMASPYPSPPQRLTSEQLTIPIVFRFE